MMRSTTATTIPAMIAPRGVLKLAAGSDATARTTVYMLLLRSTIKGQKEIVPRISVESQLSQQ